MSRRFDIFKLADDVLASVTEPVSEKVAEDASDSVRTEIGLALKTAAAALRNVDPSAVTYDDINAMLSSAKDHASAKTASVSIETPSFRTESEGTESKLGHELRNLAASLRKEAATAELSKAVKAAHTFTAAVGLKHLETALSVKD